MRVVMLVLTFVWGMAARGSSAASAGGVLTAEEMKAVYEEVKTPYKYGLILAPEKGEMFDGPCVYRLGDKWHMLFVRFDGRGYETHLAESDDLVHWSRKGCVFKRAAEKDAWDAAQADLWPILLDARWEAPNTIQKFEGRYWGMYIGGALNGYETDPLSTGVAWTDDAAAAKPWRRAEGNPVLRAADPDARAFEKKTIYKHYVVEDPTRALGGRFVSFYNAKEPRHGQECIGVAASDDLRRWKRWGTEPVISDALPGRHGISGDPMIKRIGDVWVMFYFGCGWGGPGAFDTFACSRDLKTWTKWTGPKLVQPSEPWDARYAHKPWVVKHDGVVYHFYCAVGNRGRALALATSKPISKEANEKGN